MNEEFEVLIIGSDINAYYMARNFHEEYGIKSHMIGKVPQVFTSLSNIIDAEYEENLWDKDVFIKKLVEYGEKKKGKKVLLIGTNDFYIRLIIENSEVLKKYYLFSYVDQELLKNLALKDLFYTKYKSYDIDMPKTYIFNCETDALPDDKELKKLMLPIIVKPGNNVEYYKHEFENQAKVYKLETEEQVLEIVDKIKSSGYKDNLIIQEYIPGDDTYLFDAVMYCSTDSKVQFITFAQIGLQEHTPTGIGNCTVLINGYNQYGDTKSVVERLKKFAEEIGFKGPGEFDLKYDKRDGKFKLLEINPRQGRSSYYPTACGYNIAKYIVDDVLYGKKKDFEFVSEEYALSFVPKSVRVKYITNVEYKNKLKQLEKSRKVINSLVYKEDMTFKRRKWLLLRDINYMKKYKNNKW